MNEPFDPCLVSRADLSAPPAATTSPKGFINTGDVKNRQRSSAGALPGKGRFAVIAVAAASLLMAGLTPSAALADEDDDEAEEEAAPAPDPAQAGFKKLQDAV